MAHHLAGTSNSAKRRQAEAEAETLRNSPESNDGMLSSLTKAGSQAVGSIQSRVGDFCTMGKAKVVEAEHAVEETVQHHPVVSVLAALGVGVILGSVCTMFCSRK
jgi:ElaB/YqjD/DUF883 family membrane-anchored ribosome-binding protein